MAKEIIYLVLILFLVFSLIGVGDASNESSIIENVENFNVPLKITEIAKDFPIENDLPKDEETVNLNGVVKTAIEETPVPVKEIDNNTKIVENVFEKKFSINESGVEENNIANPTRAAPTTKNKINDSALIF